MTRANNNRPEINKWGAENVRLTLFFSPSLSVKAEGWWEFVAGGPPDSSIDKPKTKERVEIGTWEGAQLILQSQPLQGRVDWVLTESGELGTPATATFPERARVFLDLMSKWLQRNDLPASTRLAIGGIATLAVSDRESGYNILSHFLNFDVDTRDTSDFLYQINRIRQSTVIENMKVNRLSRWYVGQFLRRTIAVSGEGIISTPSSEPTEISCRIELDINTSTDDDRVISYDNLVPLTRELFALASEIIVMGDVT